MAVARLGYEIDSSGAVKAAADLDKMSAAATKAEKAEHVLAAGSKKASTDMFTLGGAVDRAAASIIKGQKSVTIAAESFTGMGADVAATARELELYGAEMDRVRSKFDPLFAASKRYEQELREIAEAEKMGAINANVAAQARERAAAGMNAVNSAAMVMGRNVEISGAHVANIGAQFNDIGVMLAAGQNPFMLAVQQGTQLNQVMAQLGGGTKALRGLAAGFLSMVNPMSLATIGIIAGGAALVQWAVSAADSESAADRFNDAMSDLDDAMGNFGAVTDIALSDMDKLTEKYGEQASAVRALFRELVAVNKQQALNAAQASIIAAQDQFNELERSLRDFADTRRELLRAQDIDAETIAGVLPSEMRRLQSEVEAAAQAIADDFNLTTAQAFRIVDALNAVEAAAGPEEAAQAAAQLASAIASAADEGADLSAEMANVASSAAQAFAAVQEVIQAGAQAQFAPGLNPTMNISGLLPTDRQLGARSNRRRGGGGKSEAERHKDEQERILDQLVKRQSSETMLNMEAYSRDLEALKFALEQKKIVQEEFDDRSEQLKIELFGSQFEMEALRYEMEQQALQAALDQKLISEEEYHRRLRQIRENSGASGLSITKDFFGEAAGIMQSGNEKLFKIGKAAAVANAIVNGYSAAIAAWDKGMQAGGPPLAAAFTAISVAKTAAQISALKSASFGGGGGAGGGTSSGITAAAPELQQQQTRAIISVQSGRSRFTIEELNDITRGLQDLSDDGVIIEGFTRA